MKNTIIVLVCLISTAAGIYLFINKKSSSTVDNQTTGQQVYSLRFGHNINEDSALHVAAVKFADVVREKSKGKLDVKVYPSQQLGNDDVMVEMARNGELDIVLTPTAKMSTLVSAMQFPDLPFLFSSREDAYRVLDGETGRLLLARLSEYGLVGAAFWENGFKQFTANKPIHRPNDFSGLNIRVMKSQIISDQFRAFGANPIPIDFHKTYDALKDGVVDGQEIPLVAIASMKFYEVQKYLIISNHAYLGYVVSFSQKVINALPPELQKILIETAKELTPFEHEETRKREVDFIETIKKSGTEIITLTPEEIEHFQKNTSHILPKYRDIIGTDIIKSALSTLKDSTIYKDETAVVIGINADFSMDSFLAGRAIRRGVELAVDEINGQGGLLGKKVEIMARDHNGLADRGIANMKEFASVENLLAVIGGQHSPVVLSELDIVHDKSILYLIPWAAATAITENSHTPNYVFRISANDKITGAFLVNEAVKETQKIALLLENTAWGKSNHTSFLSAMAELGLIPVSVQWFNRGQKDMTPQIAQIAASGAKTILLTGGLVEASSILNNMVSMKLYLPVYSHWGVIGGNFYKNVKDILPILPLKFVQTFSFFSNGQKKEKDDILKQYQKKFGSNNPKDIEIAVAFAHAYDLVRILGLAVNLAQSLEPSVVRDAMERVKEYDGLVKKYSPPFTTNRHDALFLDDLILCRFDESSGVILPVKKEIIDPETNQ